MATTDGFTLATTSAKFGNTRLRFSEEVVGGGVQLGLIGDGGCAGTGAGGGLGAGAGDISMSGTAQPILKVRVRMMRREKARYFAGENFILYLLL